MARAGFCDDCRTGTYFKDTGEQDEDGKLEWACTKKKRDGANCEFVRSFKEDINADCLKCKSTVVFVDYKASDGGLWLCPGCKSAQRLASKMEDLPAKKIPRSKAPAGILADIEKKAFETDFTLVAEDGARIGCHRAILGLRSPVFAKMMGYKEGEKGEATIEEPHEVVKVRYFLIPE